MSWSDSGAGAKPQSTHTAFRGGMEFPITLRDRARAPDTLNDLISPERVPDSLGSLFARPDAHDT
jgi:hypothetical protein